MGVNIFTAINAYSTITGHPIINIPSWIWLTLLAIGLLVAPFFAYHRTKTKLDSILSATPNLEIYGDPYIDTRTIHSRVEIEGEYPTIGTPLFAHVRFINRPRVYTAEATAGDVIAEISFYDSEGKLILNGLGRWGDTRQPESIFEPIRELAKASFEPGLYRELDLAMKYVADEDCYAFGNESYFSYGWRKPEFLLKGRSFSIKVRLVGIPMVDKTWWFTLYNEGMGYGMRIELSANTMDTLPNKS
jgi:hypothetical protein